MGAHARRHAICLHQRVGKSQMTKRHSVLVVDDDVNVRSLYVDALREAGHTVTVATDGLDALSQLNDGAMPCVVLADVRMPRMDGFELVRAVRRDPQLSSVPVVAITGDRMLSFTSPARDKPFSLVELDALVQRSCALHRESGDERSDNRSGAA
jgi:CheY-like chemotaxis protein